LALDLRFEPPNPRFLNREFRELIEKKDQGEGGEEGMGLGSSSNQCDTWAGSEGENLEKLVLPSAEID